MTYEKSLSLRDHDLQTHRPTLPAPDVAYSPQQGIANGRGTVVQREPRPLAGNLLASGFFRLHIDWTHGHIFIGFNSLPCLDHVGPVRQLRALDPEIPFETTVEGEVLTKVFCLNFSSSP